MQIIKQPNGNWAVYSTIVDGFTCLDATEAELLEHLGNKAKRKAQQEVQRTLIAMEDGEKPYYQFTISWEEAVQKVKDIHGEEDGSYIQLLQYQKP